MSDFSQYKQFKDKFESLYIFVINNASIEEFNAKIEKIFKIMDNIPDSKKRGFLKSRIYDFQKNINENKPEGLIDGIFFVSDKVKSEKFIGGASIVAAHASGLGAKVSIISVTASKLVGVRCGTTLRCGVI